MMDGHGMFIVFNGELCYLGTYHVVYRAKGLIMMNMSVVGGCRRNLWYRNVLRKQTVST